ncbi:MAG: hypothetical protein WAS93_02705 [Burkholderiaceae bacterium]
MSRKFWQLDSCLLNESRLQLIVSELISYPNEFDGGYIGNPLKVREESERIIINFQSIAECKLVPEQCSWPSYDHGEKIISCLLYKLTSDFFFGKDQRDNLETFDSNLGWVKCSELMCFVIHSESFDVYVLTSQSPAINREKQCNFTYGKSV